jgi:hypothetical protein
MIVILTLKLLLGTTIQIFTYTTYLKIRKKESVFKSLPHGITR